MPRILKTVLPRIRRSLRERGVLDSLRRSYLLPLHLLQEFQARRQLVRLPRSEFDAQHNVDTDGEFGDTTHLSDLTIASDRWIYGRQYIPTHPQRFEAVMTALPLGHEDFTFIDFGSGKGRVLLMASHYPFRRIVGIEFARELHEAALRNIAAYSSPAQRCRALESVCMDFLDFRLPPEPSFLYLFDPCDEPVLARLAENIRRSLEQAPRPLYIVYVAPEHEHLLADWARLIVDHGELKFRVYAAGPA